MEHRFDALKDWSVCNRGPACLEVFGFQLGARQFAAYTILQSLWMDFCGG